MSYASGDVIYEQVRVHSHAYPEIIHTIVAAVREFPGQNVFVDCKETLWYPRYAFWDLTRLEHVLTNTPSTSMTPCVKVWLHRHPRWRITYGYPCLTWGDVHSSHD